MLTGRAIWNIGGALVLSLASLVGAYWLVKGITPWMTGDYGILGGAGAVISIIGLFVVLFLFLLWVVPRWVRLGEQKFGE